jgi:hypothetical protein
MGKGGINFSERDTDNTRTTQTSDMTTNGKATIEKSSDELHISIPSKKNWYTLLFGTAWMGAWFFGLVTTVEILFSSESGQSAANGFMTFWLIGWTVGGLAMTTRLLWSYFGKEKIRTDRNEIIFENSVFGIGMKKRLDISAIKNIRTEMSNDNWFGGNIGSFWGPGRGKVKFDYGLKTYSFGLGVDDAEANYIALLLTETLSNPRHQS